VHTYPAKRYLESQPLHLSRLEGASRKHTLTRVVVHIEAGSDFADPLEVMDAPKEKGR
jgi:hypothetical protein